MLQLHLWNGTLRTVELGSVKTEEQIDVLSKRTGLSFSEFRAEIICLRASALAKNKVVDAALVIKEFERALALNKKSVQARVGLALMLQAQEKFEEALKLFEWERKNDAGASEELRELCGMLLVQCGLLEEARGYLEKAETDFPGNGTIHLWLGKTYWRLGGELKSGKEFALKQVLLAVKGWTKGTRVFFFLTFCFKQTEMMPMHSRCWVNFTWNMVIWIELANLMLKLSNSMAAKRNLRCFCRTFCNLKIKAALLVCTKQCFGLLPCANGLLSAWEPICLPSSVQMRLSERFRA